MVCSAVNISQIIVACASDTSFHSCVERAAVKACISSYAVLEIRNSCPFSVWPGFTGASVSGVTVCGDGSIRYKPQHNDPNKCFFAGYEPMDDDISTLKVDRSSSRMFSFPLPTDPTAENIWSGNIAFRTNCTGAGKNMKCSQQCAQPTLRENGDCTIGVGVPPPVALIELTIPAYKRQKAFYDVSIIGGVNIPIAMNPMFSPIVNDSYECGSPGLHCPWRTDGLNASWRQDNGDAIVSLNTWQVPGSFSENGSTFTFDDMTGCIGDVMNVSCSSEIAEKRVCCGYPDYSRVNVIPNNQPFFGRSTKWIEHVGPLVIDLKKVLSNRLHIPL